MSDAAQDLEAAVRAKFASGELPSAKPEKVWAGKGTRQPCSACSVPIGADDIEYEVDLLGAPAAVRFHHRCLTIWNRLRDDRPPNAGRRTKRGA